MGVPLRIGARDFIWGSRTYVMGILNVTPDSFSGDGVLGLNAAVSQACQMEQDGADILDVGGESTRPATWGKPGLPAEEEMQRVVPVIAALRSKLSIPISVDTYKATVAEAAIAAGAQLVNDVWGLRRDQRIAAVVARAGVPIVVMHNQDGTNYEDLLNDIALGLEQSLDLAQTAGIPKESVICDPGIGFGKTAEQNLLVLRNLSQFRRLGQPLLVGASRKSFIGKTLDLPVDASLEGTAAVVTLAIAGGVDIVRVHDVRAMVRVARMADAIVRSRSNQQ